MNLFLELRKHGNLADKRHSMYEKNKFAKFWMYLMAFFWAGYLIFFGTMLAFAMQDAATEAYHIINSGLIFFMAIDFLLRFAFVKLPTQEVKPYLLLPTKRNRLIDFLLIRSGLSSYNLIWLFFFVPFAIISVTRFYGIGGVFTYCIGIWLLMVINNYWFLLCRTLMNERIAWVALPLLAYGGIAAAIFVPDKSLLFEYSTDLGEGFITGRLLCFIGALVVIALLWFINRKLMAGLIYKELNKVEDTKVKHVSEYKFLDRYGEVGEYMRLELKLLLRNKMCKTSLRTAVIVVTAFTALLSFTEVYDGSAMKNFILVYNFVIIGIMFLSGIMSYEGNYIDGLMSRKESIYSLLKAKYIVYSLAILIPLLLMIPAMVVGKLSPLGCLAQAIFVTGFVYCCLFQLAIYNTRTINLTTKMTNRQNIGTGLQNLIAGAGMTVPIVINVVLANFFDPATTSWILIAIGASFILTSRFWLKNVYTRFMKRRYLNMEGFRDSRQK